MAIRRTRQGAVRAIRRRRRVMRKRNMRKRISKTMNAQLDRARVVEVWSSTDISGNFGAIQAFTLGAFPRATAVSKNYRYFRCTKVELEFIPYANFYAPGTSFPELYYQKDHTAALALFAPTQASMEGRGVLPVKWTSPIKRSYSPAVLRHEQLMTQMYKTSNGDEYYLNDVQPITSTPVKYKWYMTEAGYQGSVQPANGAQTQTAVGPAWNPQQLLYGASSIFINCPVPQAAKYGRLVVKAHWEFKEPRVDNSTPNIDISGNNIFLQPDAQ